MSVVVAPSRTIARQAARTHADVRAIEAEIAVESGIVRELQRAMRPHLDRLIALERARDRMCEEAVADAATASLVRRIDG